MKQQNVANYAKIRYFEWIKLWIKTELKFYMFFESYKNWYNVLIATIFIVLHEIVVEKSIVEVVIIIYKK